MINKLFMIARANPSEAIQNANKMKVHKEGGLERWESGSFRSSCFKRKEGNTETKKERKRKERQKN